MGVGLKSDYNEKNFIQSLKKRYMRIEFNNYVPDMRNLGTGKLSFTNEVPEKNNSEGVFVKSYHEQFFLTKVDEIKYGQEKIQFEQTPFILDTGTSLMLLPADIIEGMIRGFTKQGAECVQQQGLILCIDELNRNAEEFLEPVSFTLNGTDFTFKPSEYVLGVEEQQGMKINILRFSVSNMGFALLGLPFF